MEIKTVNCPNCSGTIEIGEGETVVYCRYCGTQIIIDDEVEREEKRVVQDLDIINCEICGKALRKIDANYIKCPKCGRVVCRDCYVPRLKLCDECAKPIILETYKLKKQLSKEIGKATIILILCGVVVVCTCLLCELIMVLPIMLF